MDGLRIIKFGLKGHSDIYCLNNGRSLFVEIKIGPDKQREDQINFQKMVKNCGGLYFLIRSENDLEEMLREL